MEGWISLYRKIQDHWLWQQKRKFSKFEAWISLLFKASYKKKQILFDDKIINLNAGEFITSELKLSEEWCWSRNTVRKFLKILENQKMIYKKCTTKYTCITIINWASYQIEEQQIKQQIEQQVNNKLNTNNNINKDNNIYLFLLNKYKKGFSQNFYEKLKIIGEIKDSKEYQELSLEEQDKLYYELMSYKGG